MTSRERVMAAIEHRAPDRVPVDYWAHPPVTERVMAALGAADFETMLVRLGVDLRNVRGAARYIGPPHHYLPDGRECDMWGVPLGSRGTYAAKVTGAPLASATTVAEVERHRPFPDPDWWDYAPIADACAAAGEHAVMGGAWSPFFCHAMYVIGMAELLEAMAARPAVAEALLTRIADFYLESCRRHFQAARGGMDIFFMGDDYGGQTGPLISLSMFRRFIKPHLARLFAQAHDFGLKVMLHSCGSVYAFIPDLLEIGMEVLDPVQVRARDMSIDKLAAEFGRDLCFHGSIDTQQTLPFGTADDVRAEVRARLALFPQGGLICGPSQEFMEDVPTENILALYEAAGAYSPAA
ncbi:MAG: uroporphyrinogen decarboxylase family protein [Armatimonadota bacterium]